MDREELINEIQRLACSCDVMRGYACPIHAPINKLRKLLSPARGDGVSVHTGKDGTWVCFKTRSGKSFCFQPIQQWGPRDQWRAYIEEWCRDRQEEYESLAVVATPTPTAGG